MTNQLASKPWVIDTTNAASIFTGRMEITQIEYVQYTNISDVIEVQDKYGKIIWAASGAADLESLRSGFLGWVEGLLVPVNTTPGSTNMPSGKLLVYFK